MVVASAPFYFNKHKKVGNFFNLSTLSLPRLAFTRCTMHYVIKILNSFTLKSICSSFTCRQWLPSEQISSLHISCTLVCGDVSQQMTRIPLWHWARIGGNSGSLHFVTLADPMGVYPQSNFFHLTKNKADEVDLKVNDLFCVPG